MILTVPPADAIDATIVLGVNEHELNADLRLISNASSHPDIAARLYRALCMRVVNAGKSKYYDAALDNIEHAKKCYAKARLETDWSVVVAEIRERHYRKKGFMVGFEAVVSDEPRRREPTFMERAKRRWPKGGTR